MSHARRSILGNHPKLYNRSYARESIMGYEPTMNPTPAAMFLLKKGLGAPRVAQAIRTIIKRRRSAHKGNPLPALIGAQVLGHIPGVKNLFKTPSEKRAAAVAGQLVASANQGNLTAAKAIMERMVIGIQKERAIWTAAAAQIPKNIKDLVKKYQDVIPGVDHSSPESAAQSALASAVNGLELEASARTAAATAATQSRASRAASAATSRQDRMTMMGLGADVLGKAASALGRGGRSRRPVRRRRRY